MRQKWAERLDTPEKKKHMLYRVALVIGGNLLFAIGINRIITPMNLYSSGFTGISMLLRMLIVDVLNIPEPAGISYLGIIYWIVNMPLFYLAYKSPVAKSPLFDDYLTAVLVGGIISGTGAGLVLKGGTSGGGQDIIGVAMSKTHPNFSVGKISIAINTLVYGVCFFLFDIQTVVYSMIFAVINGLALDYQHTQNINVQVMIFTKKEGITNKVINEVKRGLTYWNGAGGYTDEDTYILMTMVTKYELPRLIEIVKKIDPDAFVMVNEGTKIYGRFEKRFTE